MKKEQTSKRIAPLRLRIALALLLPLIAAAACGKQETISLGGEDAMIRPPALYRDAEPTTHADAEPTTHDDAGAPDATEPEVDAGVSAIDLTATFLPQSATQLAPGGVLHTDISIANLGTTTAPPAEVRLYMTPPGLILATLSAPEILAGASHILSIDTTIPASLPTGDYEVYALVDPGLLIDEVNELNNESEPWPLTITNLTASSAVIDFGQVALGCTATATTVLSNSGTMITDIRAIQFAANTTPELALLTNAPQVVFPGATLDVAFSYTPSALGVDNAILRIEHSDALAPIEVSVLGEGVDVVAHEERHVIADASLDILLVIDNSGSMMEEQMTLASNAEFLAQWLTSTGIDFHIAVTTTDVDQPMYSGHFLGTPPVLTRFTPNFQDEMETRAMVGIIGSGLEQGFEAMKLALSEPLISTDNTDFLRAGAALAVIFVSDENDGSPSSVDYYATFLRSLKGASADERVVVNVIVGDEPSGCSGVGGTADAAPRYIELAQQMNGVFQSICSGDWNDALSNIGGTDFGSPWLFELSAVPFDPSMLEVEVNGAPSPPEHWSYDASVNAVIFEQNAAPEPGDEVVIRYGSTC